MASHELVSTSSFASLKYHLRYLPPPPPPTPPTGLSYEVVVDEGGSRVFSYSSQGGVVTTGEARDSGNVTITGPGRGNMVCGDTVTFALSVSSYK